MRSLALVCSAAVVGGWLAIGLAHAQAEALTLDQAVSEALSQDPWLTANQYQQQAALARSEGAGTLPDPKLNFGLMNFPTDTFDYDQEAMTQVSVGISQMLPRGETLSLQSRKLLQQSQRMPLMREQRRAQVRQTVTELWLAASKAQLSIELIEENRRLFEQLGDIATSSYSSTFGAARQQDLVRAKLELTQLQDRLVQLRQQRDGALRALAQWLQAVDQQSAPSFKLAARIPEQRLPQIDGGESALLTHLARHPGIQMMDQAIAMAGTDIQLAEQKYRPEWVINASYGLRGEDAMGDDRADLFSVGVSVDMPVFSSTRQDTEVRAANAEQEALRTERLLMLRELRGRYWRLHSELENLDRRYALYRDELLPGLHETAEASINAYTADDGSFSDVVQARISELNARLSLLGIRIERQQKIAALEFVLARSGDQELAE